MKPTIKYTIAFLIIGFFIAAGVRFFFSSAVLFVLFGDNIPFDGLIFLSIYYAMPLLSWILAIMVGYKLGKEKEKTSI